MMRLQRMTSLLIALSLFTSALRPRTGIRDARLGNADLGMTTYIEKLGILAKAWVLCAIAVAALLAYVALRVRHNLQLYGTVVKHVKHLPIGTDWMAAVFEVPLKRGQSDKIQQLPPGNVIVSART